MIKWLSCTVVIVGLLCGQIFAEEDILTKPIDYFGDKEKAAAAEARKAKDREGKSLDLENKLNKISKEVTMLNANMLMAIQLLTEQLEILKDIKGQNKVSKLSTEDILNYLSLTGLLQSTSYSHKTSDEIMSYICGYQTASHLNKHPDSNKKAAIWYFMDKWVAPGYIQHFFQKEWASGYRDGERGLHLKPDGSI